MKRFSVADHIVFAQLKLVCAAPFHNVYLIYGHPVIDKLFKSGNNVIDITLKIMQLFSVGKSPFIPEPGGIAAVGNGDKTLYSVRFKAFEQIYVVIDGGLIEFSLLRLDS